MGIFGRLRKSKESELIGELESLKAKLSKLPQEYSTGAFTFGQGVSTAQEQIPIICANIDDAIKALEKGVDRSNRPITRSQIADGIRRLVIATRRPAFVGLVSTVLNPMGVRELESCMDELVQIAVKIK
jgi:hypothetical protein